MQVKIALAKVALLYSLGLYWTENQVQQIPLLHQDKFNLTKTVNTNSTVGHTQSITDPIIALQSLRFKLGIAGLSIALVVMATPTLLN
jgi:hypothetical protein